VSNGASTPATTPSSPHPPGDEVIIPSPIGELSRDGAPRGGEPIFVQTKEENGWKMSADEFQDAMTPARSCDHQFAGNPPAGLQPRGTQAIVDVAVDEEFILSRDYEKLVYDGTST